MNIEKIIWEFECVCDGISNDDEFANLYDIITNSILDRRGGFILIDSDHKYYKLIRSLKHKIYTYEKYSERKEILNIIRCILDEKNKKHQPCEPGTLIVMKLVERRYVTTFIERRGSSIIVEQEWSWTKKLEKKETYYHWFVKVVEENEDHVCMNCGKTCEIGRMCNYGIYCESETQYVIDEILKVEDDVVTIKWRCDGSTSEVDLQQLWEDNPILLGEFLAKNGDPQNGFRFDPECHEDFRDRRLCAANQYKRENLWSATERPVINTHARYDDYLLTPDGRWLHKSRFADRRLKWANRGRRYNLHPH